MRKYIIREIEGTWNPSTMKVAITKRSPHINSPQYIQVEEDAEGWNYIYFDRNKNRTGLIVNAWWKQRTGLEYFGEIRNNDGIRVYPALPIMEKEPEVGRKMEGASFAFSLEDGFYLTKYEEVPWTYQTISFHETLGQWNNIWRTALEEQKRVYNYLWSSDYELMSVWHLFKDTMQGYERLYTGDVPDP